MSDTMKLSDQLAMLICDNVECNFVADKGFYKWGNHLIGQLCPECNSNLLTEEDFNNAYSFLSLVGDLDVVSGDNSTKIHFNGGGFDIDNKYESFRVDITKKQYNKKEC